MASLVLSGDTSGTVTLAAPAVAGTQSYTLPTGVPAANGYALTSTTGGVMSWTAPAGSTTQVIYNSSGTLTGSANLTFDGLNLGLGTTLSAWSNAVRAFQVGNSGVWSTTTGNNYTIASNVYLNSALNLIYTTNGYATRYQQNDGLHIWYTAPSGTAGNVATFTESARIDTSGNLLVGTGTAGAGIGYNTKIAVDGGSGEPSVFKTSAGVSGTCIRAWNSATSGNNSFEVFQTEAGGTERGNINYNRGAGLVAYNTTSDYRAKDIYGPVTNSGEVIDSVPVYIGKMKGATQERPMFIAHETPAYAHTGEKDAVDADGNPIYQQMDASALVPILWAEVKSLRARIAALEAK